MRLLKPILWIVLFTVFAANVHAQPLRHDYIVTLKNDTIYGNIRNSFGMAWKLETEESDIEINIKSVDSYYSTLSHTLYRRKNLPGRKKLTFLPCREFGRINLYDTYTTTSSANDLNTPGPVYSKTSYTFYAEKNGGQLVEVWTNKGLFGSRNKDQREALAELLADNPRVKQIFDGDTKYEMGDVAYYIHEYNKDAAGR